MRMTPRPGEEIDRAVPLAFTWNGRPYAGLAGDTIVSALAAAGVRVFSRSMKYHRPRGVLAAGFNDPGCLVQVGDEPNVRAAHRRLAAGMAVSTHPDGLLPITQHAMRFHNRIARHAYEGIAIDLAERERLARDLGGHNAMILENHGLLACGRRLNDIAKVDQVAPRVLSARVRAIYRKMQWDLRAGDLKLQAA